jgi:hypothetical protein
VTITVGGPRRARLVALAGGALALLVACSGAPTGPRPAEPDVAGPWFAALLEARRQGEHNLLGFYDPDVVIDDPDGLRAEVRGRSEALAHLSDSLPAEVYQRQLTTGIFLGATTAITGERITSTGSMLPVDVVYIHEMGPRGIRHESTAESIVAWRRSSPDDPRLLAVDRIARRYVQGWSTGRAAPLAGLYAPGASIRDDFLALRADGLDVPALVTQAGDQGGLPDARVTSLPGFGGPGIFLAAASDTKQPIGSLVLLLDHATAGCTATDAVVLNLEGAGRIARERRFHRSQDWVRCTGTTPPQGWWDTLPVPATLVRTRSGLVVSGASKIVMFNSTPALDSVLTWAMDRFRAAGLDPPAPSDVTFYASTVDLCRGIEGLTVEGSVSLCFDESALCIDEACTQMRTWPRIATLHELAHVWMADHVARERQSRFVEAARLPTWANVRHPWHERGVELAAATIAWALMSEPTQMSESLTPRSCARLSELYSLLTDRAPPGPWSCEDVAAEQQRAGAAG